MEKQGNYNIEKDIHGSDYYKLLDICLERCSKFLFVERVELDLSEKGKKLLEKMEPFFIEVESASEWPGTILYNEKAKIYWVNLNKDSVKLLKEFSNSLFSWQQPELPEDLCFFKKNGDPFLVTIAHENDGFFTEPF